MPAKTIYHFDRYVNIIYSTLLFKYSNGYFHFEIEKLLYKKKKTNYRQHESIRQRFERRRRREKMIVKMGKFLINVLLNGTHFGVELYTINIFQMILFQQNLVLHPHIYTCIIASVLGPTSLRISLIISLM